MFEGQVRSDFRGEFECALQVGIVKQLPAFTNSVVILS